MAAINDQDGHVAQVTEDGRLRVEDSGGAILGIQDEGTPLPVRMNMNFVGAGVAATDDAANGRTVVTIPGGGGGGGGAGALTRIAQVVLAAPAASIAFATIPNTYENLILQIVGAMSGAVGGEVVGIQLNGDTGGNYDWYLMRSNVGGTGATGGAGSTSARCMWLPGSSAQALSSGSAALRLNAYARAVLRKTIMSTNTSPEGTDGTAYDGFYGGGQWRSTAAITDILLTPANGNFVVGSVATLYGET